MLLQVSSAIYSFRLLPDFRMILLLNIGLQIAYQTLWLSCSRIYNGARFQKNLNDARIFLIFTADPTDEARCVISTGNAYMCFDADR
jgi:hypothetical protein